MKLSFAVKDVQRCSKHPGSLYVRDLDHRLEVHLSIYCSSSWNKVVGGSVVYPSMHWLRGGVHRGPSTVSRQSQYIERHPTILTQAHTCWQFGVVSMCRPVLNPQPNGVIYATYLFICAVEMFLIIWFYNRAAGAVFSQCLQPSYPNTKSLRLSCVDEQVAFRGHSRQGFPSKSAKPTQHRQYSLTCMCNLQQGSVPRTQRTNKLYLKIAFEIKSKKKLFLYFVICFIIIHLVSTVAVSKYFQILNTYKYVLDCA